jgi:hypothetical protein
VKILLIILFFVNASTVNAKTFSVTNLANSATSEDCLDYCVDGVCFWLVCGWGCSVKTTPHINHNLPDFVVSSYNEPGENSFSEVQSLDVMKNIQGGNLTTNSKSKRANSGFDFYLN